MFLNIKVYKKCINIIIFIKCEIHFPNMSITFFVASPLHFFKENKITTTVGNVG